MRDLFKKTERLADSASLLFANIAAIILVRMIGKNLTDKP